MIAVGDIRLQTHEPWGHTPGSTSYSMQVVENGKSYDVAIVKMGAINPGMTLLLDSTYPGIDGGFAKIFANQKVMKAEIWV